MSLQCSDEDDDDEDDELELQRELEQIKRDREAAAAKKADEERAESERQATAEALKGNPLLNGADSTARVLMRCPVYVLMFILIVLCFVVLVSR